MNTRSGVGFDDLPILVELREKLNEQYRAASRRPHRARLVRAHRWRPLALIVVLCLGGGTGVLAATGALQSVAPAAPSWPPSLSTAPLAIAATSVAIAGSVQVLPLRVRYPAGGPLSGSSATARLGTARVSTNTVG